MGQKYAAYDESGVVYSWRDSIDSPPAAGMQTIEITDEQWAAACGSALYTVVDGKLVAPAAATDADLLTEAKRVAVAMLGVYCSNEITAGFTCDALVSGTAYSYPAKVTDQQNLSSSVLASLMPGLADDWTTPFWCADENEVWAYRSHTAAQIQAVGVCGKNAVAACIGKKIVLEAQVAAATTIAEVEAISWETTASSTDAASTSAETGTASDSATTTDSSSPAETTDTATSAEVSDAAS